MNLKLDILSSFLGDYKKEGDEHLFRCPFNCPAGKEKRKLSVNLKKNVFRCWICGPKHIKVKKLINLARINNDAFAKWTKLTGASDNIDKFEAYKNQLLEKEVDVSDKLQFPDDFKILLYDYFDDSNKYVTYLKNRGLTFKDFLYWKPGTSKQYKFQDRVIFPSFDKHGNYNYYISRSINDYERDKYKNSWVNKFGIIFNEHNINWKRPIYLVEGIFDAINLNRNTIILLGSELSEQSLLWEKLMAFDEDIYLLLDANAADKSDKIVKQLVKHNKKVYNVTLDPYPEPEFIPPEKIQPLLESNSTFYSSSFEYIKHKYAQL